MICSFCAKGEATRKISHENKTYFACKKCQDWLTQKIKEDDLEYLINNQIKDEYEYEIEEYQGACDCGCVYFTQPLDDEGYVLGWKCAECGHVQEIQ